MPEYTRSRGGSRRVERRVVGAVTLVLAGCATGPGPRTPDPVAPNPEGWTAIGSDAFVYEGEWTSVEEGARTFKIEGVADREWGGLIRAMPALK